MEHFSFVKKRNKPTNSVSNVQNVQEVKVENSNLDSKLFFRPIVNSVTDQIIGVDLLVHFNDTFTLVPPNSIFNLNEDKKTLPERTNWMIEEACKYLVQWRKKAIRNLYVSIPISPNFLLSETVISDISSILDKWGILANQINLELTDQLELENQDISLAIIWKLKELGFKIGIKDFGTGHGSLYTLKLINPHYIKIGQMITKEILIEERDKEITKFIIHLAHKLNVKVIATGIESFQQKELLEQLDCDYFQGISIGEPVPPNEITTLIKKGNLASGNKKNHCHKKDRRKYFRINLKLPLESTMALNQIKTKAIQIGKTKVLILNIGPGGLSFLSNLNIPIRDDINVNFHTRILNEEMHFKAKIKWKQKQSEDIYRYGVEFLVIENEREIITSVLNRLQISLRKNDIPLDTSIYSGTTRQFFNTMM